MEYLINKLEIFAITKDENVFNTHIDFLNKLTITELDPDHEWETLKKNYSNLRYIYQLLNHYHYNLNSTFYEVLLKFIEPIDKSTQIYIRNINWEDPSLNLIKENFYKSLNENNIEKKIKYILDSYDILVPIVEDLRLEKYIEQVDFRLKNAFNPKKLRLL